MNFNQKAFRKSREASIRSFTFAFPDNRVSGNNERFQNTLFICPGVFTKCDAIHLEVFNLFESKWVLGSVFPNSTITYHCSA